MPHPANPGDDVLAERYGRPDPRKRLWIIAATAVVATLGVTWLVWAAWVHSTPAVSGELTGFTVVSEHTVTVEIEARRETGDAVECRVTALSDGHAIVADETVTIPADTPGTVRFTVDVTTDRRATTVRVTDCH